MTIIRPVFLVLAVSLIAGSPFVLAAEVPTPTANEPAASTPPPPENWVDTTHSYIYNRLWQSAMRLDGLTGSQEPAETYQKLNGSITPAVLWDQFRGFQTKLRFRVNVPLPQLNDRFKAVIGRVDPDEFIKESAEQSGAIARQYGPATEDETVFGLSYRGGPRSDDGFGLGAGVRIRSPLDPYVKADYTKSHGTPAQLQIIARQTIFWEQSEHAGVTSRLDLNHFLSEQALMQFSVAGTLSQRSDGLRGFAAGTLLKSLSDDRALVMSLGLDFETRAAVSLHEFGGAVAYRRRFYRDWLILETRSSLTWPKEVVGAARTASWGVGVGVEMLIGTTRFQARPATF